MFLPSVFRHSKGRGQAFRFPLPRQNYISGQCPAWFTLPLPGGGVCAHFAAAPHSRPAPPLSSSETSFCRQQPAHIPAAVERGGRGEHSGRTKSPPAPPAPARFPLAAHQQPAAAAGPQANRQGSQRHLRPPPADFTRVSSTAMAPHCAHGRGASPAATAHNRFAASTPVLLLRPPGF